MNAAPNLTLGLCLCILALVSIPGFTDDRERSSPDVRAVLIYDPDSFQSKELFTFYLPALQERYGVRLEVSGIDLSVAAGKSSYRAATERLGLPLQPDEEPIVVVGDKVFVGLIAIATTLGDNFEELARDPSARSWPPIPAFEELLPGGIEDIKMRVASEGVAAARNSPVQSSSGKLTTSDHIAAGLPIVVLLSMVGALVHSLVRLRRQHTRTGLVASRALFTTLAVGFVISGYTAYTALADIVPMCGPIRGCAAVQESEYAQLFGVPMGVLGLVGYALILVTWLMARYLSPRGGGWYWLPWAVALFGVLFSLRLTVLERFVIGATCLWCLGSAVSITTALWLLSGFIRKGEKSS